MHAPSSRAAHRGWAMQWRSYVVASGGKVVMLDVQEGPGQAAAKALGASASFVNCDVTSEVGSERRDGRGARPHGRRSTCW